MNLDLEELKLSDSYKICKVDKAFLGQTELDLKLVKDSVIEWWGNVGNYSKHGMGYCILHDQQAVCSCVASFLRWS